MITSNVTEFMERVGRAVKEVDGGSRRGVAAAALAYTVAIRANIAADTGGTSRLRGVGRHGAKVGAGFDVKGSAHPTALVSARGPLHLLENDTKPHSMTAKRGARGRAIRRNNVATVNRGHPGTKGKHPFARGIVEATPAASKVLGESIVTSVGAIFR